jgi:hypothetical protein
VELPHDLCTVWLTTCGPEVDLCALQLTPLQWTRLADCFSHAAPQLEALHSLHLPADVFVDDEPSAMLDNLTFAHVMQYWSKHKVAHKCSADGHRDHAGFLNKFAAGHSCSSSKCAGFCTTAHTPLLDIASVSSSTSSAAANFRKSLVKMLFFCAFDTTPTVTCNLCVRPRSGFPNMICPGFQCAACDEFIINHELARELPAFENDLAELFSCTGALHAPESKSVVGMMWSAVACMPNLQQIGLHGLQLSLHTATALVQLLSCAPPSVSKLTITTDTGNAADGLAEVDVKMLLFKAVASLKGLRELVMPQWEAVVGQHASECVAVLKGMPVFGKVHVAEVKDASAFPPGVVFCAIKVEV